MITLDPKVLEDLLCDPRMAAGVLMGWELDDFQAAALKLDWWFPWTIDSSGTGSGKTLRMFLHSNLRAMLIEDQWVGCYFPTWGQVGKQEFWPYFYQTMQKSSLYREQLRFHRKTLGEEKGESCWTMQFRNGSKIEMPAPNFVRDSSTQAGRSFNTLHVDEWLKTVEMGSGLNSQLIERARRPSWNKHHPVWCNLVHLHGHAQKPSHPGYVRVKGMKQLIKDGSTRHAMYSFCYRDISEAWAPKIRQDEIIRTQRVSISRDEFNRQILGLWARDGATFYPDGVIERGERMHLVPMARRTNDSDIFIAGIDVAPGQSIRADWCALKVLRLRKVSLEDLPRLITGGAKLVRRGNTVWEVSFVWGWMGRNLKATELAALIHQWHASYRFSAIVMDNGGGGQWVKGQLLEKKILINGSVRNVVPICTRDEATFHDKQPILHMFVHGGDLDELVQPGFLTGSDGFLAWFHMQYREKWERGEITFPMRMKRRPDLNQWNAEMIHAQRCIEDSLLRQLPNVRQATDKDGKPQITRRGFTLFYSATKKDGAYAGMYASAGMDWVLQDMGGGGQTAATGSVFAACLQ